MSSVASSKKYTKKNPIDHILDRSDMYCGSKKSKKMTEYVGVKQEGGSFKIVKKDIMCSPALLRIFIETLSNAVDNVSRSENTKTPCTYIRININQETGETCICNDGQVVPIVKNEEKEYIHTMIFGQLLTGSNYDDDKERLTVGRNGIGVKVCNVFSKQFSVIGVDPVNKKKLTQVWTNNMKTTKKPKVRTMNSTKTIKGFTKINYFPDFERFNLTGYNEEIISLYTRYIIDTAMLCPKVKIYFNDTLINVNNIIAYSKLYMKTDKYESSIISVKQGNSKFVITPCEEKEFQEISFVNGVYTKLGGVHSEIWQDKIFRPLLDKFNKKGKPQINIRDIKQFFRIFIVASVDKPEFDSQEKHRLEGPPLKLEKINNNVISKIYKWDVAEEIKDIIKGKELVSLKKTERKKSGFVKIDGFDPANLAGTKESHKCKLIICEGLSAKTYAVAGIKKGIDGIKGRDYYGILPFRGKMINPRNANSTSIAKNREITNLIKALGLVYNTDYKKEENFRKLRYGQIIIICDSDVDGIHIEGLIINCLNFLFPSLLERESPFVISMKTPIVRVFNKPKDLLFYDENKFNEYVSSQTKKINSKYYKGLGTTRNEDVPETFGTKLVRFICDENANKNINKVFSSKFADERKEWMRTHDNSTSVSLDDVGKLYDMDISKFIDNELIKFSFSDCERNIPNFIDGLKQSQRKILYCAKKKNLTYSGKSLKVAQFSGYVAEHSNYHHGEQNLYETVTRMANEFPGSNNIPLLYRDGQFGSRLYGGKDAANARYIFTKMDRLTSLIYRKEDDYLLERVIDDGDEVEPKFYVPIIPMILVNGCTVGIGTGWSCSVPNYNPLDIINIVKLWLKGKDISKEFIQPWYRGFKGNITKLNQDKFVSSGVIEKTKKKNVYKITELPVGLWTDNFKNNLEVLLENKKIKSLQNYSSPEAVDINVKECENGLRLTLDTLKLNKSLSTTNMVMFNEEEKLHKFKTVIEIIEKFCVIRLKYYQIRKDTRLKYLRTEKEILRSKAEFIKSVIEKEIDIMNVEEEDIIKNFIERKFYKIDNSYDYLLKMHIRTFTKQKVVKLNEDLEQKIKEIGILENTKIQKLWLRDLKEFEKEYPKFLKSIKT